MCTCEQSIVARNLERSYAFSEGFSKRTSLRNLTIENALIPLDRAIGVPSFDEMVAIVLEEVDFDDLTMNVRGRRALAIAKPTPRGY